MQASPLLAVLALAVGSPAAGQEQGTLLAEIPQDLRVSRDLLPTTDLPTFVRRSSIAWSRDGQRVAYSARRGDAEWLPVVGDQVGESYDYVGKPFLAGGRAIFRVVRTLTVSTQHFWIWIDGETLEPEDWMGEIAVHPAGEKIAYWVHPGSEYGNAGQTTSFDRFLTLAQHKGKRWSVSRAKKRFGTPSAMPLLFSTNGRRLFSCAYRAGGWIVVERSGTKVKELTDKVEGQAGSSQIVNLAISADGKAFAYIAADSSGASPELLFKGKSIAHPDGRVPLLAVDTRGKRVAYVASKEQHVTVAIGKEEDPAGAYDHVLELAFDPAGERIAFVANNGGASSAEIPGLIEGGKSFVVRRPTSGDGESFEEARFDEIRDLVWNEDGTRLAYCARTDTRWRVVRGEYKSELYDDVSAPVFSADDTSLGFGAREGRKLWWKQVPLE